MPGRAVSHQELFKAVLAAGPDAGIRDLARMLDLAPSAVHRRLHTLEDAGVLTIRPLQLLPKAIDLAGEHHMVVQTSFTASVVNGELTLHPAP